MTWALVVLCWLLVNVAIFGALHISALHRELDDALDEIERLREVAEAADQYHDVVCDPDYCRLCKALQAWRGARDDT